MIKHKTRYHKFNCRRCESVRTIFGNWRFVKGGIDIGVSDNCDNALKMIREAQELHRVTVACAWLE